MSNKIKKIEPEMEYPDYLGAKSLQELKNTPFSVFNTHDLSFVMAMVIRKTNELVDAVNAPGDKGSEILTTDEILGFPRAVEVYVRTPSVSRPESWVWCKAMAFGESGGRWFVIEGVGSTEEVEKALDLGVNLTMTSFHQDRVREVVEAPEPENDIIELTLEDIAAEHTSNRIMKKYWIKDLTEKQVIHAPTEDIAKMLCNKFHKLGLKWRSRRSYPENLHWDKYKEETCYAPSDGEFCDIDYYTEQGYEILTIDQLLDFQANEYPKVMEVSDNGLEWDQRVVFMEKNGKFLAWAFTETIKEAEGTTDVFAWKYAREIQPAPTLELTIDQIADKFNVSPEQIKIKK